MAEDAVESAGAKAPAITISAQQSLPKVHERFQADKKQKILPTKAVPRRPPRLAGRPSIPLFGLVAGHPPLLSTINILLDDIR